MAEWAASAPGLFTPELTNTVARLSRTPQCHDAALLLASHIESKIQLDTDVGTRISAYGDLARAVWRVSTEEAAAYFRRALDLAEAIGSDDFDRTNHLLELTGHYSGSELPPAAAHTLARILELNQNEDGKFPWTEYAKTMVPIAGRATLATLARLDDRDAARLGLSLGPALTILVRDSKLSVEVAVALFGLAAPVETWTWHISDFASEVICRLPQERWEWFFDLLLVEIDREDQLSPARETIERLHDLAERSLPAASHARIRIEGLLTRRGPPSESQTIMPPSTASEPPPVFPVDLTDSDDIDRQILNEEIDQSGRRWPVRTLIDLARRANSPAERLGLQRQDRAAQAAAPIDAGLSLEKIRFRYSISGSNPPWKPLRAFDDGEKVYIQFPPGIAQGDLPPLFVIGAQGDGQLVNYRFRAPYYIVDRLFGAAELRLGGDKGDVVRIERTDGTRGN